MFFLMRALYREKVFVLLKITINHELYVLKISLIYSIKIFNVCFGIKNFDLAYHIFIKSVVTMVFGN